MHKALLHHLMPPRHRVARLTYVSQLGPASEQLMRTGALSGATSDAILPSIQAPSMLPCHGMMTAYTFSKALCILPAASGCQQAQ